MTTPDPTAASLERAVMGPVYVIVGTTGEYSDRSEWVVGYVTSEAVAKEFVERASALARELYAAWTAGDSDELGKHPMDPGFSCDYTGTNYSYAVAPLLSLQEPT